VKLQISNNPMPRVTYPTGFPLE